jgi:peptidyl-prolyl cis-trans isomerase D
LTYEHPDSLKSAAKELGLTIQSTALFTQEKGSDAITAGARIRQIAFSNDVLTLQNNSEVIQVNPELAIVLRVKTHIPAALQSLESSKKHIEDKLKAAAVENKLSELARSIQQKLQTGELTPEHVNPFKWKDIGFIGRHANKIDQAILDQAFELPKPANDKLTYGLAKVPNGIAIISLSAVKDGDSNVPKEQYQAFAEQIQNSEGMLEYDLYKNTLIQKSKIVTEGNT